MTTTTTTTTTTNRKDPTVTETTETGPSMAMPLNAYLAALKLWRKMDSTNSTHRQRMDAYDRMNAALANLKEADRVRVLWHDHAI